jgi:hypothetical protein
MLKITKNDLQLKKTIMIEKKIYRVAPDSPNRCQTIIKNGQCPNGAMDKSDKCHMHAACDHSRIQNESVRNYNLTKWQNRVNSFADNSQVKSLREEIGILRTVLEETMNRCNDTDDLLLYSPRITDTVLKIEKLVKTCHQLEYATGNLLDKNAVLQIATIVVEIIAQHVDDPKIVDQVSDSIIDLITESQLEKLSNTISVGA